MELGKEYAPAYAVRELDQLATWGMVIAFGFCAGLLAGVGYSYWFDELATVSQASLPLPELFRSILFDVHPPLYPLIISAWGNVFGLSELSTRSLSAIFGVAAVLAFALETARSESKLERTLPLLVFVSAWPVIFYADEARMYSLVLLLSTAAFFRVYRWHIDTTTHVILLLLSLSHYFGTLAAGMVYVLIAGRDLWARKLPSLETLAFGAAVLIWPVIHFTWGAIGAKTGGAFWIVSRPGGAFGLFVDLFVPIAPLTRVLGFVGLLGVAGWCGHRRDYRLCGVFLFAWMYLSVLTLIDLHTPITTARNLIVLVPGIAFALSVAAIRIAGKASPLPLVALAALMIYCSADKIQKKITPIQPNRELYEYAQAEQLEPLTYYIEFGIEEEKDWAHRIFNVYAADEIDLFTGCDDGPVYILQMHSADEVAVPGCEYSVVEALDHRTRIVLAEPAG